MLIDIIGNKVQECKKYVFADMSALFYGKNELFALLLRRKILFPIMTNDMVSNIRISHGRMQLFYLELIEKFSDEFLQSYGFFPGDGYTLLQQSFRLLLIEAMLL